MGIELSLVSKYKLNNGIEIPVLGLGVYQMSSEETERAVRWALEAGYRHIDTASFYGNEQAVGKAVRESGISRGEIFVTTKLWPTNFFRAAAAFETSRIKLGLEYVDLYLLHWPSPFGRGRAWKVLEQLYAQGLCKAIGVSNYSIAQLEALRKTSTIVPAVNQVEFSPFLYRQELLAYCESSGIQVEAYSPLTRGKRLNDATIETLAKKYDKSPAQIMIRWSLQHGLVVIPKSRSKERIVENSSVFDFAIDESDMQTMDGLHANFRALLP